MVIAPSPDPDVADPPTAAAALDAGLARVVDSAADPDPGLAGASGAVWALRLAARLPRPGDPAALSFLLRLRHGGPRPWFAGDLETAAPAVLPAG